MRVSGNDYYVQRGETFVIDRLVVNKDGSPYIISSEYSNPYFLFTISSTNYAQKDRYIVNYWLSLENLKRFKYSNLKTLTDSGQVQPDNDAADYLYKYVEDGNIKYLYYVGEIDGETDLYKDYYLPFNKTFTSSDTSEWVEQVYKYEIKLVAGKKENKNTTAPIDVFDVVRPIAEGKIIVQSDINGGFCK